VDSNNIPEALKTIDNLAKTTDSSVGGASTGDLILNSTTQKKSLGALDNLKAVLSNHVLIP
jgi:hypothetical protein